ncbi:MAG: thioredoxin family protein [Deltaproteobacteria bacterium]|nr:thioredoxin family protein [Deltaproteobacteria bacterium]
MKVAILGPGCPKCKATEKAVRQAVEELGVEATIYKVEDIREIMNFRVMLTPAVVIDDEVKIAGRVPTVEEIKSLICL